MAKKGMPVPGSTWVLVLMGAVWLPGGELSAGDRFDPVRALLQEHVGDELIAGATAIVMERDQVVFQTATGWQDVAGRRPMPVDAMFRIASMTKPLTSVAVLMLVEEGRMKLTDPVSRFVPEFADCRVVPPGGDDRDARPVQRAITIHDLLTHRSGLTYGFFGQQPHARLYGESGITEGLGASSLTLEENVRRLAALPLVQQPGSGWQYGMSTDVLGRVVEVVAKRPFEEFVATRILGPLGMRDTHFRVPANKRDRVASLYEPDAEDRIRRLNDPAFRPEAESVYCSGGAGLYSTAADYVRFLRCLLNGGELDDVRLLKSQTVDAMTRNQIGDQTIAFPIHGDRFGFGVGVHSANSAALNGASPDTWSWGGIFHTYFWVDPRREVIGVLMTQLMPFDHLTLWRQFQQRTYDALDETIPARRAPGPQPGDVYREFDLHNGGNRDWRVTDPRATAEGARQFLPNPQLSLQIEDLSEAIRAEAVIDRWGGHLRTTNKSIRLNGNPWLTLPEPATLRERRADLYYSQDNPTVEIPLSMLREGANTIEGICSARDGYGWGQWGLYSLRIRIYYDPEATSHAAATITSPAAGTTFSDRPMIEITADESAAEVRVFAWYDGDDEDGDGVRLDWHESFHQMQRGKAPPPSGIGSDDEPPFRLAWDTSWVPDQPLGSIRLVARARSHSGVWSVSEIVDNLSLGSRTSHVTLLPAQDVPERFGVRAGRSASCSFEVPSQLLQCRVQSVALSLRTWHGWDEHHHPLRFNGRETAIRGNNHHYDRDLLTLPIDTLTAGTNRLHVSSDTHHHMLEVLWPGPALLVRYKCDDAIPGSDQRP